jgi:orotidine-5'-phosphate decarboxylase
VTSFVERLSAVSLRNRSLVCIGLDPDPDLMAVKEPLKFNCAIVDATKDLVCAYKPNLSFYEALGLPGLEALGETVSYIRSVAPDVQVVGDGKRGDIGSTNVMYARALFEGWGFDAATVNAYGGGESLEPYLEYGDRGVFVWCRSSNAGAAEFQDQRLDGEPGGVPLFGWMAIRAQEWNSRGNVGLVVGSTYPDELRVVRSHAEGMPILIPGVGAQGGDLEASVRNGLDSACPNILISSSRGITYASCSPGTFATAARAAATDLRDRINLVLEAEGRGWDLS